MMSFAAKQRILRAAHNRSQRELQEATGIDTRYISEIENGKIIPNPEWETRIRAALGWTPEVDAALDALAEALAVDCAEAA